MIIKIKSGNPEFLTAVNKNPDHFDGTYFRKIKAGVGVALAKKHSLELVYLEGKHQYSYADEDHPIDYLSLCSPRAGLELITTLLRDTLVSKADYFTRTIPWLEDKKMSEVDTINNITIRVTNLYIDSNYFREGEFLLSRYFNNDTTVLTIRHKVGYIHNLSLDCKNTTFFTVNLLVLILMFISVSNEQRWPITEGLIDKYVRVLNNIDNIPYFVAYLFCKRCLRTEEIFNKYKFRIESSCKEECLLEYGDTGYRRHLFVKEHLTGKYDILDVGCGEMSYVKEYINKIGEDLNYYAIDKVDFSFRAKRLSDKLGINNLTFIHGEVCDLEITTKVDVILAEVIEHLTYEEAIQLVQYILDRYDVNKIIITTPNKLFNRHYNIEGFRHPDHQFELTKVKFVKFITAAISEAKGKKSIMVRYHDIGDKVNNLHPTQGCVIEIK